MFQDSYDEELYKINVSEVSLGDGRCNKNMG